MKRADACVQKKKIVSLHLIFFFPWRSFNVIFFRNVRMFRDWVGACVAFHHCTQFESILVRTDLHLHNFAFAKKVLLPFDFPFPYFYHPNHLRFFFYNLTSEHSSGDLFAWWYSPLEEKNAEIRFWVLSLEKDRFGSSETEQAIRLSGVTVKSAALAAAFGQNSRTHASRIQFDFFFCVFNKYSVCIGINVRNISTNSLYKFFL